MGGVEGFECEGDQCYILHGDKITLMFMVGGEKGFLGPYTSTFR